MKSQMNADREDKRGFMKHGAGLERGNLPCYHDSIQCDIVIAWFGREHGSTHRAKHRE